jgi:hypothetical protein
MTHALLDLPIWLVAVLVIGAGSVLSVLVVLGLRPYVRRRFGDHHNTVFSDGFAALRTLYAFIAGLLVFAVFNTFQQASTICAQEASALEVVYRNASTFPQPYRGQAEQAVRAYTESVLDDEWASLADGEGSPETAAALDHLFAVWGPMRPDATWSDQYSKAFDRLDEVVVLRNDRIDHSRAALPPIYWFVVFGGGILTVVYFALSYLPNRTMHALSVGLMAAMLAVVIFLLLEVNHPFRGNIAVTPDAYTQAVNTMERLSS